MLILLRASRDIASGEQLLLNYWKGPCLSDAAAEAYRRDVRQMWRERRAGAHAAQAGGAEAAQVSSGLPYPHGCELGIGLCRWARQALHTACCLCRNRAL
jgi:hypothetical protein